VFEGEHGPGEVVDPVGAGADAVEDVPVLEGGEAAFAAGAQAAVCLVGGLVGRVRILRFWYGVITPSAAWK
jgi:hypothetical protein